MEIFTQTGFSGFLRAAHVLAGIAWIGLLYYFNLVQVPAFAAYGDEARARNVSIEKLASRALWWFRWAAIVTLVLGLLIVGATENYMENFMSDDPSNNLASDASILVGMLFGILMAANVWMVIWKNQKIVLANAANVLAGGEADPGAAAAGRRALLASRTNFILSFSMLWFMVATSHFYTVFGADSSGKAYTFVLIAVVLAALLELAAVGVLGGTAATNKLLWPFESHKNALITGAALWVVLYVCTEIFLG